jgi:hypothetical protein
MGTGDPARVQDLRFMEMALGQAALAVDRGQTPFGAVVVDGDGRLIGEGHKAVGDVMRERAVSLILAFPWEAARTRSALPARDDGVG